MVFCKGDIIWPQEKQGADKLLHPAIVWDDGVDGANDFRGIMLTGAGPKGAYDNIALEPHHFVFGFEVPKKPQYFVNQVFIKFSGWGPFKKVGQLSQEGIIYIAGLISDRSAMPYNVYSTEPHSKSKNAP